MSITKFQHLVRGPVAWILVIAIAISFSFFGTQGALNIFAASDEFTVDGEDAVVPFLFAINNLQAQLEGTDLTEPERALFQQRAQASAITYSIEQTLLSNFVEQQGMAVSEQDVFTQVATGYVSEVGTDQPVTKQEILSFLAARTSVDGLRALQYLQKQEAQSRFFDRTINSEFLTNEEERLLNVLQRELRDLEMIVISPKNFTAKVDAPKNEDIRSVYNASALRFTKAPRLDTNLLVIEREQIAPAHNLNQAQIDAKAQEIYSDSLQSDATTETKIRILSLDPEFTEDFDNTVETLESSLTADNFAQQASQYSTDVSAEDGGDIGWVNAGDFPDDFQQVLLDLEIGDVSGQIELDDAVFFIFKQDERLNVPDLSSITEQVALTMQAEMIQQEYPSFIANIEDLIYDGNTLDVIEAQVNVSSFNVNEVFANAPGSTFAQLGIWEPLLSALASHDSNNTELLVLGPWQNAAGQIIVAQINNLTKSDLIPFEEVASLIEDELIAEKATEMYQDSVSQILEQLFAQQDLKTIADDLEQSTAFRLASDISPTNSIFSQDLTRNIFTYMPNDAIDWIEYTDTEDNTSFFVRVISAKLAPESTATDDAAQPTGHNYFRARLAIDSIVKQNYNQDDIVIFDRSILPENL